jgi:hypothetical protein
MKNSEENYKESTKLRSWKERGAKTEVWRIELSSKRKTKCKKPSHRDGNSIPRQRTKNKNAQ